MEERKPVIHLNEVNGRLEAFCTDSDLRDNCSFVETPGVGGRCNCIQAVQGGLYKGLLG